MQKSSKKLLTKSLKQLHGAHKKTLHTKKQKAQKNQKRTLQTKYLTSELKPKSFSPANILSRTKGNSMPVLGSTAGFAWFNSRYDRNGHPWHSTSLGTWSMVPYICISGLCNGLARTFDDLNERRKKIRRRINLHFKN